MKREPSPLERQVAEVLRRARRLPVGPERNDLRQLAVGLLWLHRRGMDAALETSALYLKEPFDQSIPIDATETLPTES
jgi:hypothetical protein